MLSNASGGLNHWFHDVCLVAGSLGKTFNPSSEVWVVLLLDRHIKPTPGGDAERYVAYAEFVTGHEGIFLECVIYDHFRRQRGATQFDDFHVSIFWCLIIPRKTGIIAGRPSLASPSNVRRLLGPAYKPPGSCFAAK